MYTTLCKIAYCYLLKIVDPGERDAQARVWRAADGLVPTRSPHEQEDTDYDPY